MSRRRSLVLAVGRTLAISAAVCAVALVVAACGSSDGAAVFLAHDADSAVFVEWTRVGDDVSGTLSATEVTQPQEGLFASAAQPAGEVKTQSGPFTGTVRDGSVRLQIGSGALSNGVNGRLDGDTLELTLPQDQGVQTVRLQSDSSQDDYTKAVEEIRVNEQQRKSAAQARRVREQRAATTAITRVATAFQKALDPRSPDDPCRYLTPELKDDIVSLADAVASRSGGTSGGCTAAIRGSERQRQKPLYTGPQGVARIDFSDSLMSGSIGQGGPPGAIVTWRPQSGRGVLSQSRASFIKQNGRWLVYRCCL